MQLVLYPNECLRAENFAIAPGHFGTPLLTVGKEMLKTMALSDGAGLAAPQVGINLRLFVTNVMPHSIIANPVWQPIHSEGSYVTTEGCLSFPGLTMNIRRFNKIHVQYQCNRGKMWEMDMSGFAANVFQHEVDHLDGKLFIDHLRNSSFSIEKD